MNLRRETGIGGRGAACASAVLLLVSLGALLAPSGGSSRAADCAQSPATNLVCNGDFESGDTGFTSGYTATATLQDPQTYHVGTSPNALNGAWPALGDHTSGHGQMLVVNGATTAGVDVWSESVNVDPGANYRFTIWIASLYPGPASLLFEVDGSPVATLAAPAQVGAWTEQAATWASGTTSPVRLSLVDLNTAYDGNDFALDDLSFAHASGGISATATCFDGNYTKPPFDPPLDARPYGSYCVEQSNRGGLRASLQRDKSATDAQAALGPATAEARNGVFSFVGHATGAECPGFDPNDPQTTVAAGLLLSGGQGTVLAAASHTDDPCLPPDAANPLVRAPETIGARLVVLQACLTLHDHGSLRAIGTQFGMNGAMAVVGFRSEIGFSDTFGAGAGTYTRMGDAWAHAFWGALGAGSTLDQALLYALQQERVTVPVHEQGTVADGYESYAFVPAGAGASTLRQIVFGDDGLGVHGTGARAAGRSPRAADLRADAPGRDDAGRLVHLPGGGLSFIDAKTRQVTVAVFDRPLGMLRAPVTRRQAELRARTYAKRHHADVSRLVLARVVTVGVGKESAYLLSWQAESHGALLPTVVSVTVRIADGAVTSFAKRIVRLRIGTTPTIGRQRATRLAAKRGRVVGRSELSVVSLGGKQRLVWLVAVRHAARGIIAAPRLLSVDARTGAVSG